MTPLRFSNGEEGALLAYDGTLLTVRSPSAYAPGAPVRVVLDLGADIPVDAKSNGSRLADDGTFTVRLRPISLAKHTRRALSALIDG